MELQRRRAAIVLSMNGMQSPPLSSFIGGVSLEGLEEKCSFTTTWPTLYVEQFSVYPNHLRKERLIRGHVPHHCSRTFVR